nr:MAG TPA: hypothetical protein [Caudoviricetes sp.]
MRAIHIKFLSFLSQVKRRNLANKPASFLSSFQAETIK